MYPNQRDRQARATETPEYRKARLARRRERYREGRAEVRKQLNNGMKLGFADREELTEAQARSQKKTAEQREATCRLRGGYRGRAKGAVAPLSLKCHTF